MFEQSIEVLKNLQNGIKSVIRGRDDTIKLVLTGLVANGHVLIEDYPGSGKTTLAKRLGKAIDCSLSPVKEIVPFRRIQFTPDLLPSDVLGVNVFDGTNFHFQRGPIFAHIVLADELNRTGPKVQAAFLECMAERQVTIDNVTYPLDDLFFVIGTQNPLDLAGTYPLPLVQLDRFLLKVPMRYVDRETELEILRDADSIQSEVDSSTPLITRKDILAARQAAAQVTIAPTILEAIVNIVQATRNSPNLQFGASTRAAIMLRRALGSWALNNGRDYVTADDLKLLAPYVLLHRLKFHPGAGEPTAAFQEIIKPFIETLVVESLKRSA